MIRVLTVVICNILIVSLNANNFKPAQIQHHYNLNLNSNWQVRPSHSYGFSSLNTVPPQVKSYWAKIEADKTSLCNEWSVKVDQLKSHNLYDRFYDFYRKIGISIEGTINALRDIKSGQLPISRQAALLVFLSRFDSGCPTLNKAVHDTVKELMPYWTNNKGFLQITASSWYDCMRPSSWKYDGIISNLENQLRDWYAISCPFEAANIILNNSHFDQIISPLNAVPEINDLNAIHDLCKSDKFEQAYQIAQKYEDRFKKGQENWFQNAYLSKFHEKFTPEGIDKRYANDPIIKTFTDLHKRNTPSSYNEQLKHRSELKALIEQRCGIENPSKDLEQVIYKVVEAYEKGVNVVIEYCGNEFSYDVKNPTQKEVCLKFTHNNGALKFCQMNEVIAQAKLSQNIHRQEFSQDRILLNKLGMLRIDNAQIKENLQKAVSYIDRACSGDALAGAYRIFGPSNWASTFRAC